MKDPAPENITGSKVEKHTFEHRINWGYVAIGLAVLFVAYQVSRRLDHGGDQDEQADVDGEEIEIEGSGGLTFPPGEFGGVTQE